MQSKARGYLQGFESTASSAALWRALTEPDMLSLWLATEAEVEPRVGGRWYAATRLFGKRDAHIERFEPGSRLQLLFAPNPEWPPLSDSALVEDFIIDERKGQRMLRVIGSGIPAAEEWGQTLLRLRTGWALAFAQLQLRLRDGSIAERAA